jgi:RHS repeat-associated protein
MAQIPQYNPSRYDHPFGMLMAGRSYSSTAYKYGFNGKEKDDEMKGLGNSIAFEARIYDPRLGRFSSIDPKVSSYPNTSGYSFAYSSPILFVDKMGESPKVAIILATGTEKEDFDDHVGSLRKNGYKVIYVETGKQLLDAMKNYSPKTDPIQNLVILSHCSPGGPSNGKKGGLYTQMEIESFAKVALREKSMSLYSSRYGLVIDFKNPAFDVDKYIQVLESVQKEVEDIFTNPAKSALKNQTIQNFKGQTGAITVNDVKTAINMGEVHVKNLETVIGGCNGAGLSPPDQQDIFIQEFSNETNSVTYGARGYSSPVQNSSQRKCDESWMRSDQSGTMTSTGSNTIDLCKP